MYKKILLSIFCILSGTAMASENNFFSGYINACNHPEVYERFQKDLCKESTNKMGIDICKKGNLTLPHDVASVAQPFTMKDDGGSFLFEIKLSPGINFGGNNIIAIEQTTNNAIGVWRAALVTDEKDINKVKSNIKKSGLKLKSEENPVLGKVQATVLKDDDKRIKIVCDVSN